MSFTISTRRLRASIGVSLLCAVMLLAGCVPDVSDIEAPPPFITVLVGPPGVNLNPYTNVLSSRQIGALLFRGMFAVDDRGMPVPDLAVEVPTVANGGMNADRTQITYRLDETAEWADGEPLTADDVVFTWELIDAGILSDDPGVRVSEVSEVVALDEHTVRLTLADPDAPFAWRFVPYVMPKHLLADSPDLLSDDFWIHPVGSRDRSVTRHLRGIQVDVTPVDDTMPRVTIVFMDNDANARTVWESVVNGAWLSPPVGPVGSEGFDSVPSSRWQAFVMNLSDGRPTADLAVRQAFSALATVSVEPAEEGPYGFPISPPLQDRDALDASLEDAGWRLQPDGHRQKDGEELEIAVVFNPMSAEEGDRIQDIDMESFGGRVEEYPTFPYTDYAGEGFAAIGQFDIALLEFPIGIPYGWAWPYRSEDVPSNENVSGLNLSRVSDDTLDRHADAMRDAGDPGELRAALAAAWARLEELHVVKWDERREQSVLSRGLEGVRANPFEEYALRTVDSWRIVRPAGE